MDKPVNNTKETPNNIAFLTKTACVIQYQEKLFTACSQLFNAVFAQQINRLALLCTAYPMLITKLILKA